MPLFLVAVLLLLPIAPSIADDRVLKNVDVFELEIAADPQISPDGREIVYVRQTMDIMTDRVRQNLWIVSADGSNHRPLLSGTSSYGSPRWSPDGTRIAYVAAAEERGREIYVRWMDTGQTALVTNVPTTPRGLSWSPDGKHIAFSAFVEEERTKLATPPKKPEGAKWAPGVVVIDGLNYRSDGRGIIEPGNDHVFVVPAEGGTARQLTSGDFDYDGRLAWSPDGDRIVLSVNRNEGWRLDPRNSDLWSIDIATKEMTQLTDRYGPDAGPVFSPDGSKIAYVGYDDEKLGSMVSKAYVLDVASGETSELTGELDRSIEDIHWAGRNDLLYVVFDDFAKKKIATLDLRGRIKSLVDSVGSVGVGRPYTSGDVSVSANGVVAYTLGKADRPADVAVLSRNGRSTQLTELNEDALGHKSIGDAELITWRSSRGDYDIEGWIVKPPGFDPEKQYPLILEIHGGPFTAYGPHFSAEVQLFAAAGYVVFYTNPRGSTSYGMDFSNEIHHNYPGPDYDDLISGIDAVLELGYVDEEQLFVTGGSGGGVLTAWIVGNTDRFAAAVVAKPVINWISQMLYSDISVSAPDYWFGTRPWDDFENYWRRSPLSIVGNVNTPTMLLTGEADQRTPMHESEQYYMALRIRGVPTALVRVPEASHGIAARPSHLIAKVDNILAWFEKYRKEEQ